MYYATASCMILSREYANNDGHFALLFRQSFKKLKEKRK